MDLYGALADPVRREIVELLVRRPLTAGRVADAFGHITRPAVSRHLRLLREAGVIDVELAGRERIYRTNTESLAPLEAWIVGLRAHWDQALDALETEVYRTRREHERRQRREPTTARARRPVDPKEQSA